MDPFDGRKRDDDELREMFSQASFPSVGSSQDLLAPSPRMHGQQTAMLPDMDAKIGRAIEGAGAPGMIGEEYPTAAGGYPTAEPGVAATVSFDYPPTAQTYAAASRHQAAYTYPPLPTSYPPPRHGSYAVQGHGNHHQYASACGTQHDQHQIQQQMYHPPRASGAAMPVLDRWTCGVCQVQSFRTRAEAEAHETRCCQIFEARKAEKEKRLQQEMAAVERAEVGLTDLAIAGTATSDGSDSKPGCSTKKKSVASKDPPVKKSVVAKVQSSAKNPNRTFARERKKTQMPHTKKLPMLTVASSSASPLPTRSCNLNLVPASDTKLSDYNNLIVRNVEFFYGTDNMIGMRCLHCRDIADDSITNQSFFPGSVKALASGLGSMGARHFGMGKCPVSDSDFILKLAQAKKTHASQSKKRTGLGAYVAEFADANGIVDENGAVGIKWKESDAPVEWVSGANHQGSGVANVEPCTGKGAVLVARKVSTASYHGSSASASSSRSVDVTKKNDEAMAIDDFDIATDESTANVLTSLKKAKIENLDDLEGAFVPSDTPYFWECNGCNSHPLEYRAAGSVVYSVDEPSMEKVQGHLNKCTGRRLVIPRCAVVQPEYSADGSVPKLKIKWDKGEIKQSSGKIAERRAKQIQAAKTGIDDVPICFPADKEYTTEHTFFIASQLKRCFLDKVGGSRQNHEIGFPGLACAHCVGTSSERRFFYSSSQQLRNSFSHIPIHLAECSHVPAEVKARMGELKATKKDEAKKLKQGYQTIFIDRIWGRLHGSGASDDKSGTDESDDDSADLSPLATRRTSTTSRARKSSRADEPSSLVQECDKHALSNLEYYTLSQVVPYKTFGGDGDDAQDLPGLVCRHCAGARGRKFFTTSSEHLEGLLHSISNHVAICSKCPTKVQVHIEELQKSHPAQLKLIDGEEHQTTLNGIWKRLICKFLTPKSKCPICARILANPINVTYACMADLNKHGQQPAQAVPAATPNAKKAASSRRTAKYEQIDPDTELVTSEEASMVTEYTFYSMQQMRPCNLDNTSQKRAFDYGFPGLECAHCGDSANPRRFFYRTADILNANYAHIPNHVLSCKQVPSDVKKRLKRAKSNQANEKLGLPKGSQKKFFQKVWGRLHSKEYDENAMDES